MAQKQMKAELTCPICMELFQLPRRLPCGHAYCHRCIANLLAHNTWSSRNLMCPECRDSVRIDYVLGIEALPLDFKLSRLVEIMATLEPNNSSNSDDAESLPTVREYRDPPPTLIQPSQPSPPAEDRVLTGRSSPIELIIPPSLNNTTTTEINSGVDVAAGNSSEVNDESAPPTSPISLPAPTTVTAALSVESRLDSIPPLLPIRPVTILSDDHDFELFSNASSFDSADLALPHDEYDDYLDTLTFSGLMLEAKVVLDDLVENCRSFREFRDRVWNNPIPLLPLLTPPDSPEPPAVSDSPNKRHSPLSSSSSERRRRRCRYPSSSSTSTSSSSSWINRRPLSSSSTSSSESKNRTNQRSSRSAVTASKTKAKSKYHNFSDVVISSKADKSLSRDQGTVSDIESSPSALTGRESVGRNERVLPAPKDPTTTSHPTKLEDNDPQGLTVTAESSSRRRSSSSGDAVGVAIDDNSSDTRQQQRDKKNEAPRPRPWQGVSNALLRLGDILTRNSSPDRFDYNADIESDAERDVSQNPQTVRVFDNEQNSYQSDGSNPVVKSQNLSPHKDGETGQSTSTGSTFKTKYQKLKKKVVNLFRDSFSSSESSDDEVEIEREEERKVTNLPEKKLEREKRRWRMTRRLMSLIVSDEGTSSSNDSSGENRTGEVTEKSCEEKMEKDMGRELLSDSDDDRPVFRFWGSRKNKKNTVPNENSKKEHLRTQGKSNEDNFSYVSENRKLVGMNGQSVGKEEKRRQSGGETSAVVLAAATNDSSGFALGTDPVSISKTSNAFVAPTIRAYLSDYDNQENNRRNPDVRSHMRNSTYPTSATPSRISGAAAAGQVEHQTTTASLYDNVRPLPSNADPSLCTRQGRHSTTHQGSRTKRKPAHRREVPRGHVGAEGEERETIERNKKLQSLVERYRRMTREEFIKAQKGHMEMLRQISRQQFNSNNSILHPEIEDLKAGFEEQDLSVTVNSGENQFVEEFRDRLLLDSNFTPLGLFEGGTQVAGTEGDCTGEIESLKEVRNMPDGAGCLWPGDVNCSPVVCPMSMYDNVGENGKSKCVKASGARGIEETCVKQQHLVQNESAFSDEIKAAAINAIAAPLSQAAAGATATDVSKKCNEGDSCDDNNNNEDNKNADERRIGQDVCVGSRNNDDNNSDDDDNDPSSAMLRSTKKPKSRFRKFISSLMWVSSSSSDDDDYDQHQNSKTTQSNSSDW